MRINDNAIFLQRCPIGWESRLSKLSFPEKTKRRISRVTRMLHRGLSNAFSPILEKLVRENYSTASCLPCRAQLRATFKIRLCPSQHFGIYPEILRGWMKPVQLRFYERNRFASIKLPATFNCSSSNHRKYDYITNTNNKRGKKRYWRKIVRKYDLSRDIQQRTLLKIFPKFFEKNPENEIKFLFIREIMPTLHMRGAVSGTVRRTSRAIRVLRKLQTA